VILRLRKTLKPDAIPAGKGQEYADKLWAWQKALRKKIKKLSRKEMAKLLKGMKWGAFLRTIELKVSLEKAVYRLLQVYGLPQGGGDSSENTIEYLLGFKGYVFTLYDSHCETLHLGYLSPVELPLGKRAEMRERGETPPGDPPPEVADEVQAMIEDLVNYPIAARTGAIL